ncbi:vacuolar alkaline phosphatase [Neophaeococcomyces mojaviensis]|uniref:Vacuolar alkaline phosphatase n=1 Tax=Neophaeococcomyces mojaviensis TaxID=3383035 RepID=A0ACC3AHR5_9EURO|nr:vacuolar alkaline phosphatase [Knufia sp. JES_112]
MAQDDRPLLARADSQDSYREANEEDALLTGQATDKPEPSQWKKYRETVLSLYSILATIAIVALAIVVNHESKRAHAKGPGKGWGQDGKPTGKRNLIFMVSDGMGPASLSMTRSFRQFTELLPIDDVLVLDEHLIGSSRTRSSNSLITDSAAGATAFSCGMKSYNGAISVLPDHTPCGTVLEAAKKAGYMTGLVVTTRLTDATPACFAAHVNSRAYEDIIAEQMIGNYPLGQVVDVLIGGGRCHFLPNTTEGSCRSDDTDVVKMAKDKFGYNYIDNRQDFDNLQARGGVKLPLLALMADGDVPYEIDRVHVNDVYPSEAEMAQLALSALEAATKDSDSKGFFLMIEGSRIDHAGHGNDPAAQVHEVLAHGKTFATVLDFIENTDIPTVLVGTSDHETGGLALGRQLGVAYPIYAWYPEILANASHSASYLSHKYADYLGSDAGQKASRKQKAKYIRHELLEHDFGVYDVLDEEIDSIIDATIFWPPSYIFAEMISQRAQIGWSTHGHTAVDVNIYASDPHHARPLIGNHENIEVGKFLADFLDVDVSEVTKELVEKGTKTHDVASESMNFAWMGPVQPLNSHQVAVEETLWAEALREGHALEVDVHARL